MAVVIVDRQMSLILCPLNKTKTGLSNSGNPAISIKKTRSFLSLFRNRFSFFCPKKSKNRPMNKVIH
jgi:hypothetical protein